MKNLIIIAGTAAIVTALLFLFGFYISYLWVKNKIEKLFSRRDK